MEGAADGLEQPERMMHPPLQILATSSSLRPYPYSRDASASCAMPWL